MPLLSTLFGNLHGFCYIKGNKLIMKALIYLLSLSALVSLIACGDDSSDASTHSRDTAIVVTNDSQQVVKDTTIKVDTLNK